MTGAQLTPPSIQDGPYGFEPGSANSFAESSNSPNSEVLTVATAQKLGREIYESSTDWINAGRRSAWTESLRAFQSLHASGSKYLSTDYRYRSRLYRPKTRAMVRKSEAQTAAAFFSNQDVVSITAQDDDDPQQKASAAINQELLQYRLTKTIPWFLTVCAARQDAEVQGICVGKTHWKYAERLTKTEDRPKLDATGNDTGETEPWDVFEKTEDHPWVDLIPPENIRFDPGADWRNPIATSPYVIELIPMYVIDVKAKIASGEWKYVAESALMAASDIEDDATRRAREQGRVPGKDDDAWKVREFRICWIRENIVRYGGRDWHFFSLASAGELLTDPALLETVYLHGVRPYTCGFVVLEAHKTYPSSKVELVKDLQQAANEDWNLRFDNVKLALNPRQFVAEGSGIEITDVRTFMPGKVVMTKNPREDIVWDRPPEVTQSSYEEQDRINLDFDDIAGGFGPASMQGANPVVPETVGGMEHMAAPAATLNEYELRIFAETFVEPILRQLVKLEQAYETDPVVLAIAGQNAQLYQKFGVSEITDQLLNQELTIRVNVGTGATNPATKLRNFGQAGEMLGKLFGPALPMMVNDDEIWKEIFGLCGYKDGERFKRQGVSLEQVMQQMSQAKGGGKQQQPPDQSKVQAAQITAEGRQKEIEMQGRYDNYQAQLEYAETQMQEQAETERAHLDFRKDLMINHMNGQQKAMQPHPALQGVMGSRGR